MRLLLSKTWGILSIVLSASSIFSLLHRGFEIHLAFSMSEMLNFYREIVSPIFEFLYTPIYWLFPTLTISQWVTDTQVLSVAVTGIYVKAKSARTVNGEQVEFTTIWSKIHATLILGLCMFGLILLPVILFAMILLPIGYINHLKWYKRTLKWYEVEKVLGSVTVSSGSKMAWVTIAGIFGYFTAFTVVGFFLFNKLLS